MMKILVVSLGRRGGFPVYGHEMARALMRLADISVVVASGSENIADWRKLPCDILEIETYHDNLSALLSFFDMKKFIRIKKFIQKIRPNVVYYPGGHYWKPILDYYIPKNIPIIFTMHDPMPHPGEERIIDKGLSLIEKRKPNGYVLLNETQAPDFVTRNNLSADSVTVIPHGIFSSYRAALRKLEDFDYMSELACLRRKYFLFIGRIVKYKGIASLLKAMLSISQTRNVPLVIAGGGSISLEEEALLKKLPRNLTFFYNKWLSEAEMATLVDNAFMTILPYEGATQSGVIPLSFAFGTPAISSDSGGLKEQMIDGETGFVFEAGNVEQLARKMLTALEMSGGRYEDMRLACLEYSNEHWDWNILAQKLLAFAERVTHGKQNAS